MPKRKPEKIGIAVTTHNRPERLATCVANINKFLPPGAIMVIVDDASEPPAKDATYRFAANVGISAAKNKCLELLMDAGCDHLFLFDDDTWPIKKDWHLHYTSCSEPHMAYNFVEFSAEGAALLGDTFELYRDEVMVAHSHQRGCMLHYKRAAIERVGGFDWEFGRYGYEHGNLADRIYSAGLTTFRYVDAANSNGLFYSSDENCDIASSVSHVERAKSIQKNERLFLQRRNSDRFIDYRTYTAAPEGEDVVLAHYFTGQPDPQRGVVWDADYSKLHALIDSIQPGVKLVIFHDCFDEVEERPNVEHVRVSKGSIEPAFLRWFVSKRYLSQHPEVSRVWMVDSTDVTMVNNPFPHMEDGRIYSGDENEILASPWMLRHAPGKQLQDFMKRNAVSPLLNCGLVGGDRYTIMRFLTLYCCQYQEGAAQEKAANRPGSVIGPFDMALYNYVLRTFFGGLICHGRKVNTVFKRYQDTQNSPTWWKHK